MNSPQQHVADAATSIAGKVTLGMTHGGAAVGVVGGLAWNELAVAVGIAVSVLGLFGNWLITWYWKARHYRLEAERLEWDQRRHERREAERRGFDFPDHVDE